MYPTEKDTIDISNNLKNRADEIAKSKPSANSTDNKTILGMSTIETYKPKTIESSVEPETPEVPEAQITPEPESSTEVPASSDEATKPSQDEETKNSELNLPENLLNLYDSVQPNVNSLGDMIACKNGLFGLLDKNGNVIISVENSDYSLVSQMAQKREPQTQENVNSNDSKLNSMFNQVYNNGSLMPLPLDDVEDNVIKNEPSVSEGENDNSQEPEEENTISSFKDLVISYCNDTGESIVNKIKEIKDNAADKIAAQRIKAKSGAEKGFKFVISKAKELYQNDQNRYEAIKSNFAEKNILTLAKTKVANIKQGMINEYEDKSGGRAI